jgi:predicted CopG family antitoxin
MKMTTIKVDETNRERLRDLKRRGEPFNDVVTRLLEIYESATANAGHVHAERRKSLAEARP